MCWEDKSIRRQGFTIIEQITAIFLSFILIEVSLCIYINITQTTKNNINNMDEFSEITNSISFINYECNRAESSSMITNFHFNSYSVSRGIKINIKDVNGNKSSIIYGKIADKLYRMKVSNSYPNNIYTGELNPMWDKGLAGYFDIISENSNIYFKVLFKNINIRYYIYRDKGEA